MGENMFTNSIIVFQQIIVMFLLIAFGFLLFRKGILTNSVTKAITVLLNTYVTPCFLLRSFQRAFDPQLAVSLALVLVFGLAFYLMSIVLAKRIYPDSLPSHADLRTTVVLTNNGFMGLPLLNAMFGADGVFLGAGHIAAMATILWTYGVSQLSGGKVKFSIRQILFNPAMIGTMLGFLLFCSPVKLPSLVFQTVDFIADINTPLAMMTLGCFMAQVDMKTLFADTRVWNAAAVRLLLIPAIALVVLAFIPMEYTAKLVLITGVATPSALAAAMFGQVYDTDYLLSTRAIVLNTLLSVITLPLTIAVLEFIMHMLG